MSPIQWLNYILFIENLLGIYRNYCNQSKIKKCLIIFQIFTQNILIAIAFIGQMKLLLGRDDYGQINLIVAYFAVSGYINSLLNIVTGICYSRGFMSYYRSISRVCEYFKDDPKFLNSHEKIFWFNLSLILLFIAFSVYRSAPAVIQFFQADLFSLINFLVSQTIIRLNIVFQHFILFIVIMMVVNSFKSLNSLISVVQETVGNYDISSDEQCGITTEQIHGWVELYRDLANCCEKVTLCFGSQVLFMLTISSTNFILLAYLMCNNVVLRRGDIYYEFKKLASILCFYMSLMMLPIIAGQMTINQGVKLHRVLARLYNTVIKDSQQVEAKLIKDFIRLIKKHQIEIKLLSNIPVGVYMLLVIITLIVDYLIVLLQFNHII